MAMETLTATKPIGTGNEYSITGVILSDNELEVSISGTARHRLTHEAIDTNITTEYHTDCPCLTQTVL